MPDPDAPQQDQPAGQAESMPNQADQPQEHGGPKGPEPTRYGDWEYKGRCIDF